MKIDEDMNQGTAPTCETAVPTEAVVEESNIVEAMVADLGDMLIEYQNKSGISLDSMDRHLTIFAIVNEARAKLLEDEIELALQLFEALEQFSRGIRQYPFAYLALEMQACIHWERGDLDAAWPIEKMKGIYCGCVGDAEGMQRALDRQADILAIKTSRGESVADLLGSDLTEGD